MMKMQLGSLKYQWKKCLYFRLGMQLFLQLEGQNVFGLSLKMPIYKCRRIFNPLTFLPRHRETKKVSQRVEIQGWPDSAYFYYTVSLFKSFIFFPSQPHRQGNSNSSSWDRPSQDRHATNLALEESNHLSSAASFSPSSAHLQLLKSSPKILGWKSLTWAPSAKLRPTAIGL